MNKKGQFEMGMIIGIFMLIVVGTALLTSSAQNVGDVTNTIDIANDTLSSTNGTTLALLTQLDGKFVSDVVVYNGSDDVIVASGNYTIFQNQVINGVETALINVSANPVGLQVQAWNISYTSQPTTYDSNSGGRAIAGLITLFFALAIALVALQPTLRSGIIEKFGK